MTKDKIDSLNKARESILSITIMETKDEGIMDSLAKLRFSIEEFLEVFKVGYGQKNKFYRRDRSKSDIINLINEGNKK